MTAAIDNKKIGALLLVYFLSPSAQCHQGANIRPISATYGICLGGLDDFNIKVDGPVDVEFASLVYKRQVVGQFEITILGPDYEIPGSETERWRNGEVLLARKRDGYIGVKRYGSNDAYPNVYVYLSVGKSLPRFVSAASIMHALVACNLKAPMDFQPPPKIDSVVNARS
jgi:hypothetical protein